MTKIPVVPDIGGGDDQDHIFSQQIVLQKIRVMIFQHNSRTSQTRLPNCILHCSGHGLPVIVCSISGHCAESVLPGLVRGEHCDSYDCDQKQNSERCRSFYCEEQVQIRKPVPHESFKSDEETSRIVVCRPLGSFRGTTPNKVFITCSAQPAKNIRRLFQMPFASSCSTRLVLLYSCSEVNSVIFGFLY